MKQAPFDLLQYLVLLVLPKMYIFMPVAGILNHFFTAYFLFAIAKAIKKFNCKIIYFTLLLYFVCDHMIKLIVVYT